MTTYNIQPGTKFNEENAKLLDALPVGSVLLGTEHASHPLDTTPRMHVFVKAGKRDWRMWDEQRGKYTRQMSVNISRLRRLVLAHYPHEYGFLIELEEEQAGEQQ